MVVVVVEGWGDRGREKRQFRATDRHGKEFVSLTARRLLSDVWDYSFFVDQSFCLHLRKNK